MNTRDEVEKAREAGRKWAKAGGVQPVGAMGEEAEELLPCPFCAKTPKVEAGPVPNRYGVMCQCDIFMDCRKATPAEAIAAWNNQAAFNGHGWVYHSDDTGWEYSPNHPVESGEVPDATDIRRSNDFEDILHESLAAQNARLTKANANLQKRIDNQSASIRIYQQRELEASPQPPAPMSEEMNNG